MEKCLTFDYIAAADRIETTDMYNPTKAAQVIAYFAIRSGERALDVLKAVKLVYLADRENVSRYGLPILDERRSALPRGPVNSYTYDRMKGEVPVDGDGWSELLDDRAGHRIGLKADIAIDDLDELSDAELETLGAVWERFGRMSKWDLVEWTHDQRNVPEWEDPNGSSNPIPLERMLRVVGVNSIEHARFIEAQERIGRRLAEPA